jgi:hypothetical protein
MFSFTVPSPALEPTQAPVQSLSEALSPSLKRPGREADHSLPSSADIKNTWSYTSTPSYAFMVGCLVNKAQGLISFAFVYSN